MLFLIYLLQILRSVSTASEYACPGDLLTYECIATGGSNTGATIWTGTAFNCPSSENEITLLHVYINRTYMYTCNDGTIVARMLSVEGNSYTSQLNITVTPVTAGKTIECIHYDGLIERLLFSLALPITDPLSPPNELQGYLDFSLTILVLSWSPVTPDCPAAIHYSILPSNCGSCPTTTNHTTVLCTDVPTNGSMCMFAVQTVCCGNTAGNISKSIRITQRIGVQLTESHRTSNSDTTDALGMANTATNTVYIISISSLATALIISAMIFTTVMIINMRRSKAKVEAVLNGAGGDKHNKPMYEDVTITDPIPSGSIINTQENVAYGHTKM